MGFDGHALPMIRMGAALSAAGHDVHAWAPERFRERTEASGMRFSAHDPIGRHRDWPADFATTFALGTERVVEGLAEDVLAAEVDLVVHDTHALWGSVCAEFLGLPRIVSWPLFPPSDLDRPWAGWGNVQRASIGREAVERLDSIVSGLERRWGVDLDSWRTAFLTTGRTVICPTTALVTGRHQLPPGWHYVGPLMRDVPVHDPADRPLVYVAFGTLFTHSVAPFATAVEALAEEPVRVFVAGGDPSIRDWLGPLPRNVSVHGYVDSRAALARASVHVTHAGAGSVHESLLAGVPMVCIPQGVDNASWANRVESLGAGETVRQGPEAVRSAVRRLLEDERPRRRAQELGRRLGAYDGAGRLLCVIEEALAVEA